MRTIETLHRLAGICGLLLFGTFACRKQDGFEATANARQHESPDEAANSGPRSLPFFTVETLNPVWQHSAKTPIVNIPEFHLIDQDGQPRDSSLFQNKISVVGFIFTSCNGFCPFLIEGMKNVEKEIGSLADKVQFVAITVNPEEDTPERLKAYAQERKMDTSKSWVLLTGDKDTIHALAKKTFASPVSPHNTVDSLEHSEHIYVIDSERNLRGILNGTRVNLKTDARAMLGQLSHAK